MSVYSAPAVSERVRVTPAEASAGDTRAATPRTRLPLASATPTATPSVLLLLSGTTTTQPAPPAAARNTCEALPSPAGSCAHGAEPHAPSASAPAPTRHCADAVCTMSPRAAVPFHAQPPCGGAHAPAVTTPGAAASSDHRHDPFAIARRPPAPTVKARSVDCSGTRGSHEPKYAGFSAPCRFSLRHHTSDPSGAAPASCATPKWLPSVSESSSAAAHVPPAADAHTSVVTTAPFSSTRVAPTTEPPAPASAWVTVALPGHMATLPLAAAAPAPGGATSQPTRPADRCG